MKLKKLAKVLLVSTLAVGLLTGCSSSKNDDKTITVGASATPHAEILEEAKPLLEKEGYTLKIKEQGRNEDINVTDMKNYTNVKKEKKKYKEQLNKLNEKTNALLNNTDKINNMIDSLKVSKLNKDNYIISKDKIDEIKDYLELTTSTTKTLRDSNKVDSILNKFENDLKQHKNEVELLEKKVYSRDTEITRLKNQLVSKNEEIDELEDKIDKLQEIVDTFKELWRKLLMFLQNKFFSNDKKYEDVIEDLYYKDILDKNDIDIIRNNRYIRNKDKDDFER